MSLYKYFNAASGAILAGPRDVIDGMYHARRMFGGGLNTVWPFALVALHYLDGFSERYGRRCRSPRTGFAACGSTRRSRSSGSRPARTCSGCGSRGTDPAAFQKRLAARGVMLPAPQGDAFLVGVNETLNRTTAAELTDAFARALRSNDERRTRPRRTAIVERRTTTFLAPDPVS